MKLETPPILYGKTDQKEWNALTGWLAILHSQIGKPFAHNFPTTTKTTTATLRIEEMGIIFVDSTAGTFSITLPPAARIGAGGWYWFVKIDSVANAVTLDGSGAELINGSATEARIDAQYDHMLLFCTGSAWIIGVIRSTM